MSRLRVAIAADILLVVLGAVLLTAQPPPAVEEPAPPPEETLVQVQEDVEVREAIRDQAVETYEQVQDGEVTPAEATRDKGKASDPGAGGLEWYFGLVMGRFIFPAVAWGVNLVPEKYVSNLDAHRVNAAVCLLLYLVVGYGLMADRMPELPQDWKTWFQWALSASGLATLTATKKEMGTGTGGGE